MNFLVALKDTLIERSAFLHVQLWGDKTLLHFSSESHLEGLALGGIYQIEGLSAVLHLFKVGLELSVKDYIELSLKSWDRAVVELFPEGLMINTDDGKIHLTAAELQKQMRYQIDDENPFSIFRRQQKTLKSFLKMISKKRNLIKTTQLLKKYPGLLHASIQPPQLITMIHRFIRIQQLSFKKLFLPLTDMFRVVNREDKKKAIVIDFTRNRNVLRQAAMEKAN